MAYAKGTSFRRVIEGVATVDRVELFQGLRGVASGESHQKGSQACDDGKRGHQD